VWRKNKTKQLLPIPEMYVSQNISLKNNEANCFVFVQPREQM